MQTRKENRGVFDVGEYEFFKLLIFLKDALILLGQNIIEMRRMPEWYN